MSKSFNEFEIVSPLASSDESTAIYTESATKKKLGHQPFSEIKPTYLLIKLIAPKDIRKL